MRHWCALLSPKKNAFLTAALLTLTAGAARSQVALPSGGTVGPFDGLDWLMDRGQPVVDTLNAPGFSDAPFNFLNAAGVPGGVPNPTRPGHNGFTLNANNPGPGFPKWTFPLPYDLPFYTGPRSQVAGQPPVAGAYQVPVTVDNENPDFINKNFTDPANWPASTILLNSTDPNTDSGQLWRVIDATTTNTQAGIGGYPLPEAVNTQYFADYAYDPAVHNDFLVQRSSGQSPASDSEIASLPNTAPAVYSAIHNALLNTPQAASVWASGPLKQGQYEISLHLNGTGYTNNADPNNPFVVSTVRRALVRVSWGAGTTANGTFDTDLSSANNPINDPTTSRIFLVDLTRSGFVTLVAGDSTINAAFPCDGDPNDQLVVTLYSLTPDDLTSSQFNGHPPVITADAVQFTLYNAPGGSFPGLQIDANTAISPRGRILGPAVASGKISPNPADLSDRASSEPFVYFAREEVVPDTRNRSFTDPTNGASGAIPDPTSEGGSVPVFYCIDSRVPLATQTDAAGLPITGSRITSADKVRWRFVGNSDNSTGTAYASPLLTQVRCRDGKYRPMIYFITASGTGRSHIYALDPIGTKSTHSTTEYWEYPSARAAKDDPNILGADASHTAGAFDNLTGFGAVIPDLPAAGDVNTAGAPGRWLYDQYPSPNSTGQAAFADRSIIMGSIKGSPLIMDDPNPPSNGTNNPQWLVVASTDGHIYAFDAGGRGDFSHDPNNPANSVPGTTQRVWTWPLYGADKEHFGARTPNPTAAAPDPVVPNDTPAEESAFTAAQLQQQKSDIQAIEAFTASPTLYDANNPLSPLLIGSESGRVYSLKPGRISTNGLIVNGKLLFSPRKQWQYPTDFSSPKHTTLGPVSTISAFRPTNGGPDEYLFTAGGRVYSLFATTAGGTFVTAPNLAWAYPEAANPNDPAVPDPNRPETTAFDTSFGATSVVTIRNVLFYPDAVGGTLGAQSTADLCYALRGDGVLYGLNAIPTGNRTTTFYATSDQNSNSIFGIGATECSPTAITIQPQPQLSANIAPQQPALCFSDLNGHIFAFGAVPVLPPDPTEGLVNDVNVLPLLWEHDSAEVRIPNAPRSASPIVAGGDAYFDPTPGLNKPAGFTAHGEILQGDENGVMYAYGWGNGTNGDQTTYPDGVYQSAFGDGSVSIDIRGMDIFDTTTAMGGPTSNVSPAQRLPSAARQSQCG